MGALGQLAGGSWQEAAPAAFQLSIPALALFLAVLILTDGLGEELGWRGLALPRLLQRWPPVITSELRLPILALIADWLLVIIIGLIVFRLQRKPTDAEKAVG